MRRLALVLVLLASSAHSAAPNETTLAAAEALLRYVAASDPLGDSESSVCITVSGQEASSEFVQRLKGTNLKIVSCGGDMVARVPIGEPQLESDDNYQVPYGYFLDCGEGCIQGKHMIAHMHHGAKGWEVLRVQGSVSF